MLPYLWLSLAIVWLWLPPQISASGVTSRIAISIGWLTLAVVHGYATGIVTPLGVIAILAFALLCYRYSSGNQGPALRAATTVATILFSLALMAHVVPGFSNLLIVRDAVLSPSAVPYTLYLNFDKAQIGLFLLAFGSPLLASRTDWAAMLKVLLPAVLLLITALMLFAFMLGQVRFDPKWPAIFPIWAWANLQLPTPNVGRRGCLGSWGLGLGSSLRQTSVHRQTAEHEPAARARTHLSHLT